ncbi:MAG: 50S ribosomal protein L11 methyltransferase [Candidatus Omnitrophica bacterium]|nr:50S ribosomal protein L11 methyltransferase [Candidatus Omnitrophota bacterium]
MINKSRAIIQEFIPKIVYQLCIQSENKQALELARVVLLNVGYREKDLVESVYKQKPAIELFDQHKIKLDRIKILFGRLALPGVKVYQRRLLPKDWLTLWKSQWRPAALTKKLDVVPVWYQNKYKPCLGRAYILMDTLLSFGTGLHETTQIMAQFIEDKKGKFKSFLDIGTGTGILALVALKYGAKDVVGIDIGQLSIQAAHDNMKANQLRFKAVRADIKKYRSKDRYDFVAANLITEDLITHAPKIISFVKEGGLLAVSGISLDNLNRLRKAFSILPLRCLKISKAKQWSGLLYQKKML